MFATAYTTSPLVGAAADEIFPNITSDTSSLSDVAILTTMRALLYDRLPKDQEAMLYQREATQDAFRGEFANDLAAVLSDFDLNTVENHLFIVNVPLTSADDKKALIARTKGIKKMFGMISVPIYEKQLFDYLVGGNFLKVYTNAERSCSVLFLAGSVTSVVSHGIATLASRFFDRYFEHDAEKHIIFTDNEVQLVKKGLSEADRPDTFIAAVQAFAERFDFRTPQIKASLAGFERSYASQRIKNLDDAIVQKGNEIEDTNRKYAKLVRAKRDLVEKRTAILLDRDKASDNDALMHYFLDNRNLHLVSVNDGVVRFFVKTPLANFDSDTMRDVLARGDRAERVNLYTKGPSSVGKEDRDLLFKAIFIDESIRVWLFGLYTLSYGADTSVHAESGFEQPPEMHDCCPNPHIWRHHCMGDNQRYAIDALLAGDFIGAMDQTIGSCASVNLAEGATTEPWMDLLLKDHYGRFFETRDGQRMNFTEVMQYLKNQKEAV